MDHRGTDKHVPKDIRLLKQFLLKDPLPPHVIQIVMPPRGYRHPSGLSQPLSCYKIPLQHGWLLHPAQNSLQCSRPSILNCLKNMICWRSPGISKHRYKHEVSIPSSCQPICFFLLNLHLCKWHHQPQTLSQAKILSSSLASYFAWSPVKSAILWSLVNTSPLHPPWPPHFWPELTSHHLVHPEFPKMHSLKHSSS